MAYFLRLYTKEGKMDVLDSFKTKADAEKEKAVYEKMNGVVGVEVFERNTNPPKDF
jgi:hypothetical protein